MGLSLSDAVNQLKKTGHELPWQIQKAAVDQEYIKRGVNQVWSCIKCGFRYEALIRSLCITCPKGHDCTVIWSKATL